MKIFPIFDLQDAEFLEHPDFQDSEDFKLFFYYQTSI